jgi:hypothetical protein
MNEINSSAEIPNDDSIKLITRLREILSVKKIVSIEKQDEAGRLVALSAIQFHKESSNEIAFELMALLYLAKFKGVKEAKKRTINLSRWLKTEPPFIASLTDSTERIAATKGLSSVKFPWAIHYIQTNFANQPLEEELATAFVLWGRASSRDLAHFITDVYVPLISSIRDSKLLVKYLKDSQKFFIPYTDLPPNELAIALNTLSIAILESLRKFQNNKKDVISIHQAATASLTECWRFNPALLLQPNFIDAYQNITSSLSEYKKIQIASFAQIESATISLLIDKIASSGDLALKQLHPMRKQWEKNFPNFKKATKILSGKNTTLKNFLEYSDESTKDQSTNSENSGSVFAALLPAWDRYTQELSDSEKQTVESLTYLITKAANNANIENFGERGQLVNYDPLSHNLNSEESPPPLKVRIIRPGVLFRRPDQSIRVLIPAFTSAE